MTYQTKTTQWKELTNNKSINFCIKHSLLSELNGLQKITGKTRSEIIRSAIRQYIKTTKERLLERERIELDLHLTRQEKKRYTPNTGLLPDY